MAAAALEQSMLESKDKDTLLEMAKALGVKANARLKKSDIIDKILDTTGSSPNGSDAAETDGAVTASNGSACARSHTKICGVAGPPATGPYPHPGTASVDAASER